MAKHNFNSLKQKFRKLQKGKITQIKLSVNVRFRHFWEQADFTSAEIGFEESCNQICKEAEEINARYCKSFRKEITKFLDDFESWSKISGITWSEFLNKMK